MSKYCSIYKLLWRTMVPMKKECLQFMLILIMLVSSATFFYFYLTIFFHMHCWILGKQTSGKHCVKSALVRSFSASYFPIFALNTERYFVSLRIQSECGKIRTWKNSEYEHISRSEDHSLFLSESVISTLWETRGEIT